MADDKSQDNGAPVPPKLDLRKTGVLKGHVWPAQAAQGAPAKPVAAKPAAPPAAKPLTPAGKPLAAKPAAAKPLAAKPAAARPVAAKPAKPVATAKPATPAAARPVAAAPAAKPVAQAGVPAAKPLTVKARPGAKRETSRIPLEMAKVAPGVSAASGAPQTKTIKIKPIVPPGAIKIGAPGAAPSAATPVAKSPVAAKPAAPAPAADAAAKVAVAAAKRQTSRIPLEAALTADDKKAGPGAPKTIRLKRPGVSPAAKVGAAPASAAGGAAAPESGAADLSKTSRIDVAVDDGQPATPTRRKTIRVKRPTQSKAVKGLSVARSGGAEATAEQPDADGAGLPPSLMPSPMTAPAPKDKAIVSGIASIAALIVAMVLVYILLAQVVGPNASLTKLSYGMPEIKLAWPGRVPLNE